MVLAAIHDAPEDQLFTARALSTDLEIPFHVTSKAMQGMNRAGILSSTQGKQGGYRVKQDLETVSLDALIKAVGPAPALTACLHHGGKCQYQEKCSIRTSISRLDQRVQALFKEVNVLELIQA